jgi:hypothetical protein
VEIYRQAKEWPCLVQLRLGQAFLRTGVVPSRTLSRGTAENSISEQGLGESSFVLATHFYVSHRLGAV